MNKNITLIATVLALCGTYLIHFVKPSHICTFGDVLNRGCQSGVSFLMNFLLAICLLLIPIILTLPLNSSVFEAWKRLFFISVIPMLIGTYWIASMPIEGGFGPSLNELLYFPLFGGYYLLSIIVIIWAWVKSRKTGE